MKTLEQRVKDQIWAAGPRDCAPDIYIQRELHSMTNPELLALISEALEEMLPEEDLLS